MRVIWLTGWLVIWGSLALATPRALPIERISAPTHEEPREVGWENFSGKLAVSENWLAIYEAWDPVAEALTGRIRVLRRRGLSEIAEMPLSNLGPIDVRGVDIGFAEGALVVGLKDHGSHPARVALYDVSDQGLGLRWVADLPEAISDSITIAVAPVGIVVGGGYPATTVRLDPATGAVIGEWAAGPGIMVGATGMLEVVKSTQWNGIDEFRLIDWSNSGRVVDLRRLEGMPTDYREFYVSVAEGVALLLAIYDDRTVVTAYDLAMGVLWSRTDPPGDWYQPAVDQGRILVDGDDQVSVYDLRTGEWLADIHSPVVGDDWFGWKVEAAGALIYIRGQDEWWMYDRETLAFQGKLEAGDHPLGNVLFMDLPNSDWIALVYNFNDYTGFLYNSDYWNPQVLLYDPDVDEFVAQLDPEDSIIRSGSGTSYFARPEAFGVNFFSLPDGRIGLVSNQLSEGNGIKYQVFDPVLRVSDVSPRVAATVSFEARRGFRHQLMRQAPGGAPEPVGDAVWSWDDGELISHDISLSESRPPFRWSLRQEQRVVITSDYQPLVMDIENEWLDTGHDFLAMAPAANAIVVAEWGNLLGDPGVVRVLDANHGEERFALGPFSNRFGTTLLIDGDYLLAGGASRNEVVDLHSGESLFTAAGGWYVMSGGVVVGRSGDELSAYDLANGAELFRITPDPSPGDDERLLAGGDVMVSGLRVYDLHTGAVRFDLVSPNPEEHDHFAARVAVGAGVVVAVATGQGIAYVFDAETGDHLHSLSLPERPEGYTNYGTRYPMLAIDEASGILAWAINDHDSRRSIDVFDLAAGRHLVSVQAPRETIHFGGEPHRVEREVIGDGVALLGNQLWLRMRNGNGSTGSGVARLDLAPFRDAVLLNETPDLTPEHHLELRWFARRDLQYTPWAGGGPDVLEPAGDAMTGDGGIQSMRLLIPEDASQWFGQIRAEWVPPPPPIGIVF